VNNKDGQVASEVQNNEEIRRRAFADAAAYFGGDRQLEHSAYYVDALKNMAINGLRAQGKGFDEHEECKKPRP
jgi:hypothetical protein